MGLVEIGRLLVMDGWGERTLDGGCNKTSSEAHQRLLGQHGAWGRENSLRGYLILVGITHYGKVPIHPHRGLRSMGNLQPQLEPAGPPPGPRKWIAVTCDMLPACLTSACQQYQSCFNPEVVDVTNQSCLHILKYKFVATMYLGTIQSTYNAAVQNRSPTLHTALEA